MRMEISHSNDSFTPKGTDFPKRKFHCTSNGLNVPSDSCPGFPRFAIPPTRASKEAQNEQPKTPNQQNQVNQSTSSAQTNTPKGERGSRSKDRVFARIGGGEKGI